MSRNLAGWQWCSSRDVENQDGADDALAFSNRRLFRTDTEAKLDCQKDVDGLAEQAEEIPPTLEWKQEGEDWTATLPHEENDYLVDVRLVYPVYWAD